jgi:hypothetical protein
MNKDIKEKYIKEEIPKIFLNTCACPKPLELICKRPLVNLNATESYSLKVENCTDQLKPAPKI